MACYTLTEVNIDDNALNRRARKALGLAEEGALSYTDAQRVKVEAGVIKATESIRRLQPTAQIKRAGNKLTVTVQA